MIWVHDALVRYNEAEDVPNRKANIREVDVPQPLAMKNAKWSKEIIPT